MFVIDFIKVAESKLKEQLEWGHLENELLNENYVNRFYEFYV